MADNKSREETIKQVESMFIATIASEGGQGTKGLPLQMAIDRFKFVIIC